MHCLLPWLLLLLGRLPLLQQLLRRELLCVLQGLLLTRMLLRLLVQLLCRALNSLLARTARPPSLSILYNLAMPCMLAALLASIGP